MEKLNKVVELTILKPKEGFVITQSNDVSLSDRVFSTELYLGATDSIDNWKEISIEEANTLKEQAAKEREDAKKAREEELKVELSSDLEYNSVDEQESQSDSSSTLN